MLAWVEYVVERAVSIVLTQPHNYHQQQQHPAPQPAPKPAPYLAPLDCSSLSLLLPLLGACCCLCCLAGWLVQKSLHAWLQCLCVCLCVVVCVCVVCLHYNTTQDKHLSYYNTNPTALQVVVVSTAAVVTVIVAASSVD